MIYKFAHELCARFVHEYLHKHNVGSTLRDRDIYVTEHSSATNKFIDMIARLYDGEKTS